MTIDDGQPHDPARMVPFDQDESRCRLQALPLRAIAAFAARWGLRMEGFFYRLSLRDQHAAIRLIQVVVIVACGGLVTGRLEVTRLAFRFQLIALRWYVPSAWHRARMQWALIRNDATRFSVCLAAHADAVAYCNLAGAVAGLGHAALAIEDLVESADRNDEFDESLASRKAELIASALAAASTVAVY
ncbi:hypothetical protein BH23PLA1_BH23PLA1_07630 [soil metagenome]